MFELGTTGAGITVLPAGSHAGKCSQRSTTDHSIPPPVPPLRNLPDRRGLTWEQMGRTEFKFLERKRDRYVERKRDMDRWRESGTWTGGEKAGHGEKAGQVRY